MNRPKFAIGEIVDYMPGTPEQELGLEVVDSEFYARPGEVVRVIATDGIGRRSPGWWYKLHGWNDRTMTHETTLRKRPDKREPFSLESMKKKYSPDKVEA